MSLGGNQRNGPVTDAILNESLLLQLTNGADA